MAEQRVNAAGEIVELNEDTDRWEPVKDEKSHPAPVKEEDPVAEVPEAPLVVSPDELSQPKRGK